MLTSVVDDAESLAVSRLLKPVLERLVDATLREGLSLVLETASDGSVSDELEQQLDQVLHTVVQEILDDALAGPNGAELQAHAKHAIAAGLHRDGSTVQEEGGAALSTLAQVASRVLQAHQKDLVGLVTRVGTRVAVDKVSDNV